jgi:outer membrane autotransporter protein
MTSNHYRQSGISIAIAIALSSITSSTLAQTTNWSGGAYYQISDIDGDLHWVDNGSNWATTANWSNGLPGANDVVNIDRQSSWVPIGFGHAVAQVTNAQSAGSINIGTNSSNGHGQLEVRNGGKLNVGNTFSVGTSQGATGIVTVNSGGVINNDGNLIIGDSGVGTLTLTDRSAAQSGGSIIIGDRSGASGTITVDSSSILTSGKDLIVGENGQGTLVIKNGGKVSNQNSVIADHTGSYGSANVSGDGSTWTSAGDLTVGQAGVGTLLIRNGAEVQSAGTTVIGSASSGKGGIAVDNASLSSGNDLIVAENGQGTLSVDNGGKVSNHHSVIADHTGSKGSAFVSGADSTWTSTGDLTVGQAGVGTLELTNGAEVQSAGTTVIGSASSANGSVSVNNSSLSSGNDLIVAENGQGTLSVENGGKISNHHSVIADRQHSNGSVSISGAGSSWTSIGDLTVGNSGNASLSLDRDSHVSAGSTGSGVVYIANEQTAGGTINIGAASNNAAEAISAGHLDADSVVFGQGKGVVNFNHTNSEYQFNAAFEGTGTINHIAGATVLNGDSSRFGGATNLTGGDLVVNNKLAGEINIEPSANLHVGSNNGTTGEVLSDISNNGVVKFDRSNDYTYAQIISGTGSVEQIGSGTTLLTGDNTYLGGTLVRNGTLQLGEGAGGGSTGSIVGDISLASPGSIAFNRSNDYTFAGVISGDGTVYQQGAGRTELTSDSSNFIGNTLVNAGILAVNGKLGGSNDVMDSATLAGAGQVGTTTLHHGSTIAPGNSIGTLSVAGGLNQKSGSTYQTQLLSTGARDHLAVAGATQLDDGSVINVTKLDANRYELDRRYAVLTSDQGVTGRYALTGDTHVSSFYNVVDNYDVNSVYLDVQQTRLFQEAAVTDNQYAVAAGAQSLKGDFKPTAVPPLHNELFEAIAYLPNDREARNAFDQLSGEFHASLRSALIEDTRLIRDAANNRLLSTLRTSDNSNESDAEFLTGTNAWITTLGSWGEIKGDGNAATLTHNTKGIISGIDSQMGTNGRIGVLAGYSNSDLKTRSRNSSGNNDNIHLGVYAGARFGQLNLRTGAAYTWSRIDAKRSVSFEGYSDRLKSKYDASSAQIFGELGYGFDLGQNTQVEPFANLTYVSTKTDAFKESGAAAALQSKRSSDNLALSTLGLRASTDVMFANGRKLKLSGGAGWRHTFGTNTPQATFQFDGSDSFRIEGVKLARNSAVIEAGLETDISKSLSLGVSYNGQLSNEGGKNNGLLLNARFSF